MLRKLVLFAATEKPCAGEVVHTLPFVERWTVKADSPVELSRQVNKIRLLDCAVATKLVATDNR